MLYKQRISALRLEQLFSLPITFPYYRYFYHHQSIVFFWFVCVFLFIFVPHIHWTMSLKN